MTEYCFKKSWTSKINNTNLLYSTPIMNSKERIITVVPIACLSESASKMADITRACKFTVTLRHGERRDFQNTLSPCFLGIRKH